MATGLKGLVFRIWDQDSIHGDSILETIDMVFLGLNWVDSLEH